MRALVDDLLALSRLEQDAAPASRELIDVDEILEEAAAEGRMISGGAHEIKIAKVASEGILGDFKDMRSAVFIAWINRDPERQVEPASDLPS